MATNPLEPFMEPGSINPIAKSSFRKRLSVTTSRPGVSNGVDLFSQTLRVIEDSYRQDTLANIGEFRAFVLRVDHLPGVAPKYVLKHFYDQQGQLSTQTYLRVWAAVDNIHSHLPVPTRLADGSDEADHLRIERYSEFYAPMNSVEEEPNIGDICLVEFLDKENLRDGIFKGVVSRQSISTVFDETSAKTAFKRKVKNVLGDFFDFRGARMSRVAIMSQLSGDRRITKSRNPKQTLASLANSLVLASKVNTGDPSAPPPFMNPVPGGGIGSKFLTRGGTHEGVDIVASAGEPVVAAADGIVVKAVTLDRWLRKNPASKLYFKNRRGLPERRKEVSDKEAEQISDKASGGYRAGMWILIQHDNKFESRYMHLQEIFVKSGQFVKQGQLIGRVGRTAIIVSRTHVHFEIRNNKKRVGKKGEALNPEAFFGSPKEQAQSPGDDGHQGALD